MNLYDLLDRLRSRPVLVAVIIVGACITGLVHSVGTRKKSIPAPLYSVTNSRPVTSVVRDLVPVRPMPLVMSAKAEAKADLKPLATLQIHVVLAAETNPPALGVFAPAGRKIRAATVNTIDSSSIETPIVALVTESLWFGGEEVVPVGSELHGRASVDRLRDRIVANGPWTIVWQNGEELTVNANALDRDDSGTGRWGERDGTIGLTGQVLKSDSSAEIKFFLSTFMSGASGAFEQTQNTLFGTQSRSTVRNAGIAGASQVLNNYAQQIAETIRKDGVFVRVPAGKQMYLYVTHTIDRSAAKIGNLRVGAIAPPALRSSASVTP